jgi:hypothetical protein
LRDCQALACKQASGGNEVRIQRDERPGVEIRILVSFEPEYHAYQGVIAASIRILRPHTEVETTSLDTLGQEVERLDPELVICSQPNTVDLGGRIAWVELSIDPARVSKVCVAGRYWESTNLTLEVLLAVIDEVEDLIRTNDHLMRC